MKFSLLRPILFSLLILSGCDTHLSDMGKTGKEKHWDSLYNIASGSMDSDPDSARRMAGMILQEADSAGNAAWKGRALLLIGKYYTVKGNPDTSNLLYKQAGKIGDSLCDSVLIMNSNIFLGVNYLDAGYYHEALPRFKTALDIALVRQDTSTIIQQYNNLGSVSESVDDLVGAQDYQNRSISLSILRGDTFMQAISTRNLGYILQRSGDSLKARDNFLVSLSLLEKIENKRWIATVYSDLGIYYRYKNQDSSFYFYDKALELYRVLGNETSAMVTHFNMANLLYDRNKYFDAIQIYRQIYEKCLRQDNLIGQAYSSVMMGTAYTRLKQTGSAEKYLSIADSIGKIWNQPDYTLNLLKYQIELMKVKGDQKAAFAMMEWYVHLNDSILKAQNQSRILELQKRFDNTRQELEIAHLKQQTGLQQQELKNRKRMIIVLTVGLSLIILLLIIVVLFYRKNSLHRRKIQENADELRELNASKDRFFSVIAHDLKSPFSTIFGFTDLLSKDLHEYSENEVRHFLENISHASHQAYLLLENLLIWAQSQQNTIGFQPENLDLQATVGEAIRLVESQALQKNIAVSSSIQEQVMVFADHNLTSTVLRNLLTNAIKFTHPGGKVMVSASITGSLAEISVEDTGTGISPASIEKLFRIDNPLKMTGTAMEKGSGLGLILCREITEKQGGTISVSSEPGKGSRFTFTLPIKPIES